MSARDDSLDKSLADQPDELEEARVKQRAEDDELFLHAGFTNVRKAVLESVALVERAAARSTLDAMVRHAERRIAALELRDAPREDVDSIRLDVRVFKAAANLLDELEQIGKDAQARATITEKLTRGHRRPRGKR